MAVETFPINYDTVCTRSDINRDVGGLSLIGAFGFYFRGTACALRVMGGTPPATADGDLFLGIPGSAMHGEIFLDGLSLGVHQIVNWPNFADGYVTPPGLSGLTDGWHFAAFNISGSGFQFDETVESIQVTGDNPALANWKEPGDRGMYVPLTPGVHMAADPDPVAQALMAMAGRLHRTSSLADTPDRAAIQFISVKMTATCQQFALACAKNFILPGVIPVCDINTISGRQALVDHEDAIFNDGVPEQSTTYQHYYDNGYQVMYAKGTGAPKRLRICGDPSDLSGFTVGCADRAHYTTPLVDDANADTILVASVGTSLEDSNRKNASSQLVLALFPTGVLLNYGRSGTAVQPWTEISDALNAYHGERRIAGMLAHSPDYLIIRHIENDITGESEGKHYKSLTSPMDGNAASETTFGESYRLTLLAANASSMIKGVCIPSLTAFGNVAPGTPYKTNMQAAIAAANTAKGSNIWGYVETHDWANDTPTSDGVHQNQAGENHAAQNLKDDVASHFAIEGWLDAPAETPTICPNGGAVLVGQEITLTSATPGASIYWTDDGSDPTEADNLYDADNKPTLGSVGEVDFRATAFADGFSPSEVALATFTVGVDDGAGPVLVSATLQSTGTLIVVAFSDSATPLLPASAAFRFVLVTGDNRAISPSDVVRTDADEFTLYLPTVLDGRATGMLHYYPGNVTDNDGSLAEMQSVALTNNSTAMNTATIHPDNVARIARRIVDDIAANFSPSLKQFRR